MPYQRYRQPSDLLAEYLGGKVLPGRKPDVKYETMNFLLNVDTTSPPLPLTHHPTSNAAPREYSLARVRTWHAARSD